MAGQCRYKYSEIEQTEFRLIKFTQYQRERISAVLQAFSIGEHPKFQALSYTWMSNECRALEYWNIEIDSCSQPVLNSLKPFVQALISKGTLLDGTWWWIDCVCINQTDEKEKAEQIKLMRDIYVRADQVVIWLGEESGNSNLAIEFIQILFDRMEQRPKAETLRLELEQDQYSPHWAAFEAFITRRWWSRIWTVQEFVLSTTCQFCCGTREISRRAVCQSLRAVDKCTSSGIKETIAFRYAWNRRRAWFLYQEAMKLGELDPNFRRPLSSLAAYFCCMDATDDRDRLYSLRALATDGQLLDVDYSLSTEEVYLRFAQELIQRHQSLDIICLATVHGPSKREFPSWVPDWRKRDAFLALPVMVSQSISIHIGNMRDIRFRQRNPEVCYAASGNRKTAFEFIGSALSVQGLAIDAVAAIGGNKNSVMIHSDASVDFIDKKSTHASGSETRDCSTDILKSVCRALVLDRRDRFLRYPAPLDEFFMDFLSLCAPSVAHASNTSSNTVPELQEWYGSIKALRMKGRDFESIFVDAVKAASFSISEHVPNQDEYIQDSFIGRFFDTVIRMSLRLVISREGRVGMVPNQAMKEDLVCILFGCSVPVLLRPIKGEDAYSFVGECFLDGFMQGEALQLQHVREQAFLIS